MKLQNPFPEYGYFGSEYFCDREKEGGSINYVITKKPHVMV